MFTRQEFSVVICGLEIPKSTGTTEEETNEILEK